MQKKIGSNPFNVCTVASAPTDYWAQAGMQFDESNVSLGWTDTFEGCAPQFISLAFSTGDELKFRIYIDDANDEWTIWIDNVDDVASAFTKVISVSSSSLMTNDDIQTSVWFENQQGATPNWHSDFAADPVVNSAHYQKPTSTSWWFWTGEAQVPNLCSDGTVTGTDLMSGTFVNSPHDVTFDVSEIKSRCS
ncbi:hypothetical protein [Nitrosopumilus ureiphilus]|uniref:Uncharacterized protein n=1 Tax=Nitrosopumilus ureiphilus TaxID=1470067 RepID=A0A7D5M6E0_9ARCH|nr:hypothetical protein [Nitrosopumilus ureiphilus]QLH07091.1 hypothetical protein C5F50_08420 [Nitrosopumilus ureiphilus]